MKRFLQKIGICIIDTKKEILEKKKKDVRNLNRKTYRICLVMIILVAILSAVLYFQIVEKKELNPKDGVFVWDTCQEGSFV